MPLTSLPHSTFLQECSRAKAHAHAAPCVQFGGMQTIPEEGDRFYGPFASLAAARRRPASSLGGHPAHHAGSAEPYFAHSTFDNMNSHGALPPGFGSAHNSSAPMPYSGPPASASPMDVALTGCPPPHGGMHSGHGMHLDAAQPVPLAPDDHSWSFARNSSVSAPPAQQAMFGGRGAGRPHTHSHNTRANAHAHATSNPHGTSKPDIASILPANAQALFCQPPPQHALAVHNGGTGSSGGGNLRAGSPRSCGVGQQAFLLPDPPPGFLISANRTSCHLLAMVQAADAPTVSGALVLPVHVLVLLQLNVQPGQHVL